MATPNTASVHPKIKLIHQGMAQAAQPDFTSLAVRHELAAESADQNEPEVCDFLTGDAKPSSKAYVPVNFIPAEVCAFLAAWEASYLAKMDLSDHMQLELTSVPGPHNGIEPVRFPSDLAAPRRFYRTFWISLTRRLLEISRTQSSDCMATKY
jgi:hypothetical protein